MIDSLNKSHEYQQHIYYSYTVVGCRDDSFRSVFCENAANAVGIFSLRGSVCFPHIVLIAYLSGG